jgi:ribosome-binding protein aMBF1 (putative translation factor)
MCVSYYVVLYASKVQHASVPRPSPSYANDPALIALGKAIRQVRQELNLSQEELAHQAGVDRAYVSGIERAQHNVAVINLTKISRALGIKLAELFRRAKL